MKSSETNKIEFIPEHLKNVSSWMEKAEMCISVNYGGHVIPLL